MIGARRARDRASTPTRASRPRSPATRRRCRSTSRRPATAQRELAKVTRREALDPRQRDDHDHAGRPAGRASSLPVLRPRRRRSAPAGDWFNSPPLTLAALRGKVVLIDFWTYSCINCLRTLPHLEAWYRAYHRDGLVIIGVHTPEFAFEHVASNVGAAVKRLGIAYPVVQDNDYGTWTNYSNQYWPAEYLIDQQGRIRAYDFGEGGYGDDRAEHPDAPRRSAPRPTRPRHSPDRADSRPSRTSASSGSTRSATSAAPIAKNQLKNYTPARPVPLERARVLGRLAVEGSGSSPGSDAALTLHFHARDVYLVLGGRGTVSVAVDGKPEKRVKVDAYKLYTLETARADAGRPAGAPVHAGRPGVRLHVRLGRRYWPWRAGALVRRPARARAGSA